MKKSAFHFCLLCGFWLVCFSLLIPKGAGAKEASDNEILAIGSGTINHGDIASAKAAAISQALTKAMEEYLATRLGEADMINEFAKLVTQIIPSSKEGIENFQILAENTSGSNYQILVKVRVNREIVEERLRVNGISMTASPNLKILLMVSERHGENVSYWWKGPDTFSSMDQTDVALYRALQERGFTLVNHTLGIADSSFSPEMTSSELDDGSALKWGKLLSADVVIYGKSVFSDDSGVSMELRALSVKEGVELGEEKGAEQRNMEKDTGEPESEDRMLDGVARKLADRLAPSLLLLTSGKSHPVGRVLVTFKGIENYKELRSLEEFLKTQVPGVKSVIQNRVTAGIVTFLVEFAGSRESFLTAIREQKGLPLKLSLEEIKEDEIVLSVAD